jgi:hypothetical protein
MAVSDARVMAMMRAELKEAGKRHEKPPCEECARLHVMLARERREYRGDERIKRSRLAQEVRNLREFLRMSGLEEDYAEWLSGNVRHG